MTAGRPASAQGTQEAAKAPIKVVENVRIFDVRARQRPPAPCSARVSRAPRRAAETPAPTPFVLIGHAETHAPRAGPGGALCRATPPRAARKRGRRACAARREQPLNGECLQDD